MSEPVSAAATVANLRDLADADPARVKPGVAIRSAQLDKLDVDADPDFVALGVSSIVDLRTETERSGSPDIVPAGAVWMVADVLADAPDADPARLAPLLSDVKRAHDELSGGRARESFKGIYADMVTLPSARSAYRLLLSQLLEPADAGSGPDRGATLFHCTAGKDRTGWGAGLLLTLAGVPREQVMADYLSSNPNTRALFAKLIDQFIAAGGEEAIVLDIVEVREEYLDTSFATMESEFGDIDGYLGEGLGFDEDTIRQLREAISA